MKKLIKFVTPLILLCFVSACNNTKKPSGDDNTPVPTPVVEDKDNSISINVENKVYDGQPMNVRASALSGGEVTLQFKESGDGDSALTRNAPKNAGTYVVNASVAAGNGYKAAEASANFTISQKEVELQWIAPADLVYNGEAKVASVAVKASSLVEGDDVHLTCALTPGADNVNVGSFTYMVTGIDNTNYKLPADIISPSFTIAKGNPSYTLPTNLSATYGQTLADVALPERFSWQEELSTPVGNAGNNQFHVVYTPADTDNYVTVRDIVVSIAVAKGTPTYTVPTGITATYGQILEDVILPTGFVWEDNTQSVGNAGEHQFMARFTPEDNQNYSILEHIPVTITVNKATPSFIIPTNLTAEYGDSLSSIALPEGFSWEDSSLSVGNAGDNQFNLTYTPADTDNYNVVNGISANVTVNKINPQYQSLVPTNLTATYGQHLSEIALPEGFAWEDPTELVGDATGAEPNVKYARFTPADTVNYNVINHIAINLAVSKADTQGSLNPINITYGTSLGEIDFPEGYSLANQSDTDVVPIVGNLYVDMIYNPDPNNYKDYEFEVLVNVQKATPVPVVPENIQAAYGTKLSSLTISDGFGNFVINADANATVGEVTSGTSKNLFTATYVPTDSHNYRTVENIEIGISVYKISGALLEIDSDLDKVYDGQPIAEPIINHPEDTTPVVTYSADNGQTWLSELPVNAGDYIVKAVIDDEHYERVEATKDFVIARANQSIAIKNLNTFKGVYNPDNILYDLDVEYIADSAQSVAPFYQYALSSSDEWSSDQPTEAGNYKVRISVPESVNYNAGSIIEYFSITTLAIPEITITDVKFSNQASGYLDYIYNGSISVSYDVRVNGTLLTPNTDYAYYVGFKPYGEEANWSTNAILGPGKYIVRAGVTEKAGQYAAGFAYQEFEVGLGDPGLIVNGSQYNNNDRTQLKSSFEVPYALHAKDTYPGQDYIHYYSGFKYYYAGDPDDYLGDVGSTSTVQVYYEYVGTAKERYKRGGPIDVEITIAKGYAPAPTGLTLAKGDYVSQSMLPAGWQWVGSVTNYRATANIGEYQTFKNALNYMGSNANYLSGIGVQYDVTILVVAKDAQLRLYNTDTDGNYTFMYTGAPLTYGSDVSQEYDIKFSYASAIGVLIDNYPVVCEFKEKGQSDTEYSAVAPYAVGEYVVRVRFEHPSYGYQEITANITIVQPTLVASYIDEVYNKAYLCYGLGDDAEEGFCNFYYINGGETLEQLAAKQPDSVWHWNAYLNTPTDYELDVFYGNSEYYEYERCFHVTDTGLEPMVFGDYEDIEDFEIVGLAHSYFDDRDLTIVFVTFTDVYDPNNPEDICATYCFFGNFLEVEELYGEEPDWFTYSYFFENTWSFDTQDPNKIIVEDGYLEGFFGTNELILENGVIRANRGTLVFSGYLDYVGSWDHPEEAYKYTFAVYEKELAYTIYLFNGRVDDLDYEVPMGSMPDPYYNEAQTYIFDFMGESFMECEDGVFRNCRYGEPMYSLAYKQGDDYYLLVLLYDWSADDNYAILAISLSEINEPIALEYSSFEMDGIWSEDDVTGVITVTLDDGNGGSEIHYYTVENGALVEFIPAP